MKRLALSVVRDHDAEAAQVLGDLVMETYGATQRPGRYGGVETGRVRLALFQSENAPPRSSLVQARKILTRGELLFLNSPDGRALNRALFSVPARETLYATDYFARHRTEDAWRSIFTMWVTDKRDTYQAMIRQRILPKTIRFHDLVWKNEISADLGYRLLVERTPKGRKKPQSVYLFTVTRQDSPATAEVHFRDLPNARHWRS